MVGNCYLLTNVYNVRINVRDQKRSLFFVKKEMAPVIETEAFYENGEIIDKFKIKSPLQ